MQTNHKTQKNCLLFNSLPTQDDEIEGENEAKFDENEFDILYEEKEEKEEVQKEVLVAEDEDDGRTYKFQVGEWIDLEMIQKLSYGE